MTSNDLQKKFEIPVNMDDTLQSVVDKVLAAGLTLDKVYFKYINIAYPLYLSELEE